MHISVLKGLLQHVPWERVSYAYYRDGRHGHLQRHSHRYRRAIDTFPISVGFLQRYMATAQVRQPCRTVQTLTCALDVSCAISSHPAIYTRPCVQHGGVGFVCKFQHCDSLAVRVV